MYILKKLKSLWYYVLIYPCYKLSFKQIGKRSKIFKPIILTPKFIELGNDVYVWQNARIEGVTKYNNVTFNPLIVLSNNVSIQQNVHITCANSIFIGENTAIAANVTITDINHPYENILVAPELQDIIVSEVVIGQNCKIYNNVVILPGVHLGRHNIVGANSVVRHGVYPDYCVLAGSPAKIVKQYSFENKKWI